MRTAAIACAVALAAGCGDLPPHGEAIVVVDTNLPAPSLLSQLRVDLYRTDGAWFESRDIRLPDARDWPVSFSLVAPNEDAADVLVRVRGFPEGRLRRYEGERFRERVDYVPPFVPHSIEQVCANAPLLELGKTVTLRRAFRPFPPDWVGDCAASKITTGTVAARVVIPETGSYKFGVVALSPDLSGTADGVRRPHAVLALRTACDNPQSWLACSNGLDAKNDPEDPEVQVDDLEAGTYYVMAAGWFESQGADLTLAVARSSDWHAVKVPPPPADEPEPFERFLDGDPKKTPTEEPQPESTVDRLLAIRLKKGDVRQVHVVLRGECSGTMADLADGLASARTCTDREGVLEPLSTVHGVVPSPVVPMEKTFGFGEPCPPDASSSEIVCVPGGPSLLGFPESAGAGERATTPERLAVLERFWIDRHEVTVARFRAALAQGFVPEPGLGEPTPSDSQNPRCTYGKEKGQRENHPLNCIPWAGARAFCQFLGGDLPTEAQWEYVAQTAGRDVATVFPWGSAAPCCAASVPKPCHQAALHLDACLQLPMETTPVDAFGGPFGDVSAGLEVVGLAGNVREWARDAFHDYDHPCWRASRIHGRSCEIAEAPERPTRGGSFYTATHLAVSRGRFSAGRPTDFMTGLRCVYPTPAPVSR